MKKMLTLMLMLLSIAVLIGCADNESIPSDDLYTIVSEKKMPYYCKKAVAKEFGLYAADIYLYPLEYKRGAKIIYGKYSEDSTHLKEFACLFNADDTFAGIKMQHSNVKNVLCYKK